MTRPASLEQHPDLIEMRERYERAGSSSIAQVIDGLGLLAGLYLAISPWVVGFNNLPRLSVSNIVTGIAVAAMAIALASAYGRTYGISWVVPVIGIWTIVSPWITGSATRGSIWNNVVTGIVILLLGLGAVAVGSKRMPGMSQRRDVTHRGDSSNRSDMPNMPNRPDMPHRP
ncbi:hypothetical protein GCM10022252_53820 [Streptosporangium oxazolinicum]|uniref:SPW repeat-containing integral membrane domain-containing protein n=1 Tax=Streptosporangium oxazolinicum TaxID=909287 RepID=A0ABP8B9E6_9ACTN